MMSIPIAMTSSIQVNPIMKLCCQKWTQYKVNKLKKNK